ncbi:hypothetical protein KA531_03625 [Candidatus Saccharibacteria bacterium]|nr:hypothetical protein [Candidatus Saccharibacteria bacterium]
MDKIDQKDIQDTEFEDDFDHHISSESLIAKSKLVSFVAMVAVVILVIVVIILVFILAQNKFDQDKVYQEAYNTGIIDQRDIDRIAFQEQLNNPFTVYQSPEIYGGFKISYPKSYSTVYNNSSSNPISIIAHPGKVDFNTNRFALKIELIESPYSQEKAKAQDQDSKLAKADQGYLIQVSGKEAYYRSEFFKDIQSQGAFVLIPIQDKTLLIRTDSLQLYEDQFNQIIENVST